MVADISAVEDNTVSNAKPGAVAVGSRMIGPGQPVYVIAEAGVNHNGSVDTALRMVDAARAAGADAVKFQAFRAARLASRHAEQAAYQKATAGASSQVEMLARLELGPGEFARIRGHCEEVGIEFLATPFGPEDLGVLLDLGVRAVKIASPDIINLPLLEAVAGSRLPVLLSTGASLLAEIDLAQDYLVRRSGLGLVLLHCVSSYPTKLEQANLVRIEALERRYGCAVGFSDHTGEVVTARLARVAGAHLLEKHFTLDRGQPGPDHAFSLLPGELAEYVRAGRQAERRVWAPDEPPIDASVFDLDPKEEEVRRVSRCSVTAARDIGAGTVISRDVLTAKRPGTGISPWQMDAVAGRIARHDIAVDTPITWSMLR